MRYHGRQGGALSKAPCSVADLIGRGSSINKDRGRARPYWFRRPERTSVSWEPDLNIVHSVSLVVGSSRTGLQALELCISDISTYFVQGVSTFPSAAVLYSYITLTRIKQPQELEVDSTFEIFGTLYNCLSRPQCWGIIDHGSYLTVVVQ